MFISQLLASVFVIIGCCFVIYVCCIGCYSIILNKEIDEDKLMDRVYIGVGVMTLLFILTLFVLIFELTLHLIS